MCVCGCMCVFVCVCVCVFGEGCCSHFQVRGYIYIQSSQFCPLAQLLLLCCRIESSATRKAHQHSRNLFTTSPLEQRNKTCTDSVSGPYSITQSYMIVINIYSKRQTFQLAWLVTRVIRKLRIINEIQVSMPPCYMTGQMSLLFGLIWTKRAMKLRSFATFQSYMSPEVSPPVIYFVATWTRVCCLLSSGGSTVGHVWRL